MWTKLSSKSARHELLEPLGREEKKDIRVFYCVDIPKIVAMLAFIELVSFK